MSRIFLVISCIFIFFEADGQQRTVLESINNNNISYSIFWTKSEFHKDKVIGPNFLIRVVKSSSDSLLITQMKPGDWIAGLNNPTTDWAACLLLCERYKKNVLYLMGVNKEKWELKYKEVDIKYWINFLIQTN